MVDVRRVSGPAARGRRGSGGLLLGGGGDRRAVAAGRRLRRRAARWWAATRRRFPAAVVADAAGVTMVRSFFGRLSDTFGWTFVALLVSAYLGVKGSLTQLTTSAQLPYFKNLGITGTEYQAYGTAAMTPWAMKALIGTISDAVPLGGYHKRNYILLAAMGGSLAFVLLATLHITPSWAALAAFLLFCGQLELATVDLLVEGTYARVGADGDSGAWSRGGGGSAGRVVCVQRMLVRFYCLARGGLTRSAVSRDCAAACTIARVCHGGLGVARWFALLRAHPHR